MSEIMMQMSPAEAATAKPGSPERIAFLKYCQDVGDPDRIRMVGEFLSAAFRVPIPSRPVTFNWGRFNKITGQNIAVQRDPVPYTPPGLPKGVVLAKGKPATKAPSQVAESYILTIDGQSLNFVLGDETVMEFSPKLGRNIIRTTPKMQMFKNRCRTVDPFTNLNEYLFFWMHPTNISSPARFSPDEKKKAGVKLEMENKYNASHVLPTISTGVLQKQRDLEIAATNESIEMTTKLANTDEKTLKQWSKQTGFDSGKYAGYERLVDAYRAHLNGVVNSRLQTSMDAANKEKLRILMQEGDDSTREIVMKAISLGLLIFDDLEWYCDMKDGKGILPFAPLSKYMVPQASEQIAADWLCIELDRRRDTKAIAAIDEMIANAPSREIHGRAVSPDMEAAINAAIAREDVTVTKTESGAYYWVNSDGEQIVKTRGGRGVTKQHQLSDLLLWASASSEATVLANLGISDDGI